MAVEEIRLGKHVTLDVDTAGGSTFAAIGSLVDIQDLSSFQAAMTEVSKLGDATKSFRPVDIDEGQLKFKIRFDINGDTYVVLKNAMTNVNKANWKITYAAVEGGASETETFLGYVENLSRSAGKADMLAAEVTIRRTLG